MLTLPYEIQLMILQKMQIRDLLPLFDIPEMAQLLEQSGSRIVVDASKDAELTTQLTAQGRLNVIKWLQLHSKQHFDVLKPIEAAAEAGHLPVLKWMFEHHSERFFGAMSCMQRPGKPETCRSLIGGTRIIRAR